MISYDTERGTAFQDNVFSPVALEAARCSEDQLNLAMLLGVWETASIDGHECTVSKFEGKIYFVNTKKLPTQIRPLRNESIARQRSRRDLFSKNVEW